MVMYDNESETIIHEQKRIKFKPRIKLNHNIDDHIVYKNEGEKSQAG